MNKKQYQKDWYKKNKDRVLERQKQLKEENPERFRAMRKKVHKKYNLSAKGIFNILKKNCTSRNNKERLAITQKDFIEWYEKEPKKCCYCNILENLVQQMPWKTSKRVKRLSIDRKDNSLPYQKGNLALACIICNRIKYNIFTYEEMLEIGKKYIEPRWRQYVK